MHSADPNVDWSGVRPDSSPIGPLDPDSFVSRLRLPSERARSLTLLREAFRDQHAHGEHFLEILSRLHDNRVRFVIVGGVAAGLHGGSRVTFDLAAPRKSSAAGRDPIRHPARRHARL